jgi:hypothetical protein
MDIRALRRIVQLAKEGLPVCLKQIPEQPGQVSSEEFASLMDVLTSFPHVSSEFSKVVSHKAFITGIDLPDYWCRVDDKGNYIIFLAQPLAKDLRYPVYGGQSWMDTAEVRNVEFSVHGKSIPYTVTFDPYQSVLLRISPGGQIETIDITFVPRTPEVRPREPQRTYF